MLHVSFVLCDGTRVSKFVFQIYTSDVSPFHMFAFSPSNSFLGVALVGGSLPEVKFLMPSIMVIVLYYFKWCSLPFVF